MAVWDTFSSPELGTTGAAVHGTGGSQVCPSHCPSAGGAAGPDKQEPGVRVEAAGGRTRYKEASERAVHEAPIPAQRSPCRARAGRKEAAVLRPNAYGSVNYFYRSIFATVS